MELALVSFMSSLGFTFAEILKMLVLVGFTFVFQGILIWRIRKPIIALYHNIMTATRAMPELKTSVDKFNGSLQEHIVQTDLRMSEGEDRFRKNEFEIEKLKAHIGLK